MNLTCDGSINAGPPAQTDGQFPSNVTSIPFTLNTGASPKGISVQSGASVRQINSPSAFVTLSGVGASDDVTQASFVYMRVMTGAFQFRVTYHNPSGSPIVSVLPSAGIFIHEPDASSGFYVTQLEVQGAGTLEWFAAGSS